MSRIRGLELLFNLEKKNFKSAADCAIAAFHCLLINEGLQCLGIGDEWGDLTTATLTELLPKDWNSNQELYSLRYISKDRASRILLKIVRADHMLLVNAVKNEGEVAIMSFPISKHVSEAYDDFSVTYTNLESLSDSFRKEILEVLNKSPNEKKKLPEPSTSSPLGVPFQPSRPFGILSEPQNDPNGFRFPRVGGNDLDPFANPGSGGMLIGPSGLRMPPRPDMPGIGGPGGLPRGSVPPGARFDPIYGFLGPRGRNPDSDIFMPPPDDFM